MPISIFPKNFEKITNNFPIVELDLAEEDGTRIGNLGDLVDQPKINEIANSIRPNQMTSAHMKLQSMLNSGTKKSLKKEFRED